MKAKKKQLDVIAADSLGVSLHSQIKVLKVTAPATRQAGVKVDSVDTLIDKLKHEAKVI
jgi:electron transfer flavoprotein beta subunit